MQGYGTANERGERHPGRRRATRPTSPRRARRTRSTSRKRATAIRRQSPSTVRSARPTSHRPATGCDRITQYGWGNSAPIVITSIRKRMRSRELARGTAGIRVRPQLAIRYRAIRGSLLARSLRRSAGGAAAAGAQPQRRLRRPRLPRIAGRGAVRTGPRRRYQIGRRCVWSAGSSPVLTMRVPARRARRGTSVVRNAAFTAQVPGHLRRSAGPSTSRPARPSSPRS